MQCYVQNTRSTWDQRKVFGLMNTISLSIHNYKYNQCVSYLNVCICVYVCMSVLGTI